LAIWSSAWSVRFPCLFCATAATFHFTPEVGTSMPNSMMDGRAVHSEARLVSARGVGPFAQCLEQPMFIGGLPSLTVLD